MYLSKFSIKSPISKSFSTNSDKCGNVFVTGMKDNVGIDLLMVCLNSAWKIAVGNDVNFLMVILCLTQIMVQYHIVGELLLI